MKPFKNHPIQKKKKKDRMTKRKKDQKKEQKKERKKERKFEFEFEFEFLLLMDVHHHTFTEVNELYSWFCT